MKTTNRGSAIKTFRAALNKQALPQRIKNFSLKAPQVVMKMLVPHPMIVMSPIHIPPIDAQREQGFDMAEMGLKIAEKTWRKAVMSAAKEQRMVEPNDFANALEERYGAWYRTEKMNKNKAIEEASYIGMAKNAVLHTKVGEAAPDDRTDIAEFLASLREVALGRVLHTSDPEKKPTERDAERGLESTPI